MQQSLGINLKLSSQYNETCLENLLVIVKKYELHQNCDLNNQLYKTFKELAEGLEEFDTIMKYLAAHPDIYRKVKEFLDDAFIETEDEPCSSYEQLFLIDSMTSTIIHNDGHIPHDEERVKTIEDSDDLVHELNAGFNVYCRIHNVISVDNIVALKGSGFYEKYPPDNEFDKTLFTDITEAVYQWFTSRNGILDPVEIKAWFLAKYICLSNYYNDVMIMN